MNEEFDPAVTPAEGAADAVQEAEAAAESVSEAAAEVVPEAVPAAPEVPAYQPPIDQTPAYRAPEAPAYQAPAGPYAAPGQPAQPVYPYGASQAAPQESRPARKSPYAPMSSIGMAIQLFLMNIPVIGLILSIVWACGVCRKIARRNLARAYLILLILGVLLAVAAAIVARFCFADEITRLFEQVFPGYTIRWG